MIGTQVHRARRVQLTQRTRAPVLLMGNGELTRNLPMNKLPFRQDSNFLYFVGCNLPDAAALIVGEHCTLFLPKPDDDDALWHGPTPSLDDIGAALGVDAVRPAAELQDALLGIEPMTLSVADESKNALASGVTGKPLRFGSDHGDELLVDIVIDMRRCKSDAELDLMAQAAGHTAVAFDAVMRGTSPGGHERTLTALFEAILAARGCTTGYQTILSQRGEVLHNHHHDDPLQAGRLLLLDGGGELGSGYGVDITRTWPVSGVYSPRQRAAYQAVLDANLASINLCRPGVRYRDVHDASSLVIARFLADEGLVTVSPEEAVERGAQALFFPHGVGHLLGLDVHDLENYGDRPSYPPDRKRPEQFGTCYLRLDLPLEAGWVVTVEPGFYVVPAILNDPILRERFADAVDFDKAAEWVGFGGIRIEDDVAITLEEPRVLTDAVPKTVHDIQSIVGSGPTAQERLC